MNIPNNAKYFEYLYELQKSGRTNMFGAGAYLEREQGLDRKQAREIFSFWMQNYEEIAKQLSIEI